MDGVLADTSFLIFVRSLREQGQLSTVPILLADGFDESWFDGGQHELLPG